MRDHSIFVASPARTLFRCYVVPMPVVCPYRSCPTTSRRVACSIGLDLGTKTIGVATSDPDRRLATAVATIARKKFSTDAEQLLKLAAERQAVGFVLGLPAQHGRQRGAPGPINSRLRPQPRGVDTARRSRSGTSGSPPRRWSVS